MGEAPFWQQAIGWMRALPWRRLDALLESAFVGLTNFALATGAISAVFYLIFIVGMGEPRSAALFFGTLAMFPAALWTFAIMGWFGFWITRKLLDRTRG